MDYALWLLFLFVVGGGWVATLFGLPGNWLMVLATVGYWFVPAVEVQAPAYRWKVVGVLVVVALLAELAEFLSGAAGMKKGGSKRGAILAVLGSFVGSLVGASVGFPLPVIGPIVGVVAGACFGAMGGAWVGEKWKGKSSSDALEVGTAAFWGRLYGTFAKVLAGAILFAVASIATCPAFFVGQ